MEVLFPEYFMELEKIMEIEFSNLLLQYFEQIFHIMELDKTM